jgi:hypothetical protein
MDWTKFVEPCVDGADTQQIEQLVEATALAELGTAFEWPIGPGALINAEVRTLDFVPKLTNIVATSVTPEFLQEVDALLQVWPTYYAQIRALLVAVYPVLRGTEDTAIPRPGIRGGSYGTRGKDVARHFGQVYGTADNPHGFAEAIVSSIGNWKLYSTGIKTDVWSNTLITNGMQDLVRAQVRTEVELKPIGAVLHAQYAILHILEWNLRMAASNTFPQWAGWYEFGIKQHAPRIERGLATLEVDAQTTPAGAEVMEGLCAWSRRLLSESQPWL